MLHALKLQTVKTNNGKNTFCLYFMLSVSVGTCWTLTHRLCMYKENEHIGNYLSCVWWTPGYLVGLFMINIKSILRGVMLMVWCQYDCQQIIFTVYFWWENPHTGKNRQHTKSLDDAQLQLRLSCAAQVLPGVLLSVHLTTGDGKTTGVGSWARHCGCPLLLV